MNFKILFLTLACATTAQGAYRPYGGFNRFGGNNAAFVGMARRILSKSTKADFCNETLGGIDVLRLTTKTTPRDPSHRVNGHRLTAGKTITLDQYTILQDMGNGLAKVKTTITVSSNQAVPVIGGNKLSIDVVYIKRMPSYRGPQKQIEFTVDLLDVTIKFMRRGLGFAFDEVLKQARNKK